MDELYKLMLEIDDDECMSDSEKLEWIRNFLFEYAERTLQQELKNHH